MLDQHQDSVDLFAIDREWVLGYSQSVMNFVVHSHQSVVLADAVTDPLFSRDPFIQQHGVKSLLCLPLMHRGGLTSVLYLDNRTSAGLFRRDVC